MIRIEEWNPKDIELENNAEIAVKNYKDNLIITAGPGAGKTELLAQKASFLLETNSCSFPKKILAISFKVDSAENLKERVEKRVGKELAKRFDSMTFDAFSKGMMDRFYKGLKKKLQPKKEYDIESNYRVTPNEAFKYLDENLTHLDINSISLDNFDFFNLFNEKQSEYEKEKIQYLARRIYMEKILKKEKSELTFPIINRIVEHIFKTNPLLLKALQSTYSHVFLDEFQDTTVIQYDLLKTCFKESKCILTAVGDTKQKIMGFAGALEGIFDVYKQDFHAKEIELISNFRSAPQLVKIQHNIIKALLGDVENLPEAKNTKYNEEDGVCQVFDYDNDELEAQHTNDIIKLLLENERINPREICIMVRQTALINTTKIREILNKNKINSRIEDEYFILLKEPIIRNILDIIKISTNKKYPLEYQRVKDLLINIYNIEYESKDIYIIENRIQEITNRIKDYILNNKEIDEIVAFILETLNENKVKNLYPQYKQDKYFRKILMDFINKIKEVNENNDYVKILERFEGKDIIPIMTMHKSKGLEFNTVIYIGLEDENLWDIKNNLIEEMNGFFVAFSRAKYRIIFTSCKQRNGRRRNTNNVERLYNILEKSGITKEEITY